MATGDFIVVGGMSVDGKGVEADIAVEDCGCCSSVDLMTVTSPADFLTRWEELGQKLHGRVEHVFQNEIEENES